MPSHRWTRQAALPVRLNQRRVVHVRGASTGSPVPFAYAMSSGWRGARNVS